MNSDRKWSEGVFRHIRRGAHDQAAYHATRGHPDLMRQYYEGKYGEGAAGESGLPPLASEPQQSTSRQIQINGTPLTESAWAIVHQLEQMSGASLPDGSYWYDAHCGAFGVWGYGTWLFLPAKLALAGPLPAQCSGAPTGIYINGRDVHPTDLQSLYPVTGPIQPGYYYLDANGNMGIVGQPPLINLRGALGL